MRPLRVGCAFARMLSAGEGGRPVRVGVAARTDSTMPRYPRPCATRLGQRGVNVGELAEHAGADPLGLNSQLEHQGFGVILVVLWAWTRGNRVSNKSKRRTTPEDYRGWAAKAASTLPGRPP
jgi:hypothetical protein